LSGKFPGEKILDYWTPGSQLLADPIRFLRSMEQFKKEDLTEDIINKLEEYIKDPNFQPAKVIIPIRFLYIVLNYAMEIVS
jgi:dynein heavy chain